MNHFIDILDHTPEELERILAQAKTLKARLRLGIHDRRLAEKSLGMFFEKPSLRTRVSLEVAMTTLGGNAIDLDSGGAILGKREAVRDLARVMSRYVDVIALRTYSHETVREMAAWSSVPVINTLSDASHPTQAMADMLTLQETLGEVTGKTVVYLGDGNNVARSLAAVCAKVGMYFIHAGPEDYQLDPAFVSRVMKEYPAAKINYETDPAKAVKSADAVYTDVWASMGQEAEAAARRVVFMPYQVNAELLSHAAGAVPVLHCLPAHRGEEITDEVMESAQSVVFEQAENRMHINRSLFTILVTKEDR